MQMEQQRGAGLRKWKRSLRLVLSSSGFTLIVEPSDYGIKFSIN
jgi:hypothetical protein